MCVLKRLWACRTSDKARSSIRDRTFRVNSRQRFLCVCVFRVLLNVCLWHFAVIVAWTFPSTSCVWGVCLSLHCAQEVRLRSATWADVICERSCFADVIRSLSICEVSDRHELLEFCINNTHSVDANYILFFELLYCSLLQNFGREQK